MFTITTTYTSNAAGTGVIVAKGAGKQRTIKYDHSRSPAINHFAACGTLLNVLTDDRQQAMLRHPSGGQRIVHEASAKRSGQDVFTISV